MQGKDQRLHCVDTEDRKHAIVTYSQYLVGAVPSALWRTRVRKWSSKPHEYDVRFALIGREEHLALCDYLS
jgi:hypothetical protein